MEKKLLSNRSVKAEYDKLENEYIILEELLRARLKSGLSQADIAKKMGTKAPAVCRIESPTSGHSPSLRTLQKYAAAIGCKLEIKLTARKA
jgi:transcriptional regulator with XRE-family HTH domain